VRRQQEEEEKRELLTVCFFFLPIRFAEWTFLFETADGGKGEAGEMSFAA